MDRPQQDCLPALASQTHATRDAFLMMTAYSAGRQEWGLAVMIGLSVKRKGAAGLDLQIALRAPIASGPQRQFQRHKLSCRWRAGATRKPRQTAHRHQNCPVGHPSKSGRGHGGNNLAVLGGFSQAMQSCGPITEDTMLLATVA